MGGGQNGKRNRSNFEVAEIRRVFDGGRGVRRFGDIDWKGVQNGRAPEIGDCPGPPVGLWRPWNRMPLHICILDI